MVYLSIVGEYVDVFSKELPRLPPSREMEFYIDLVQYSNTIFIPPY